jgi:hypothetical protein
MHPTSTAMIASDRPSSADDPLSFNEEWVQFEIHK